MLATGGAKLASGGGGVLADDRGDSHDRHVRRVPMMAATPSHDRRVFWSDREEITSCCHELDLVIIHIMGHGWTDRGVGESPPDSTQVDAKQ